MTIGVVVESFSYVFQLVGGAKSITREEMRAFKKVWAEFASESGHLQRDKLVPFLGVSLAHLYDCYLFTHSLQKLSGVFEVRIYPVEYSVTNLRESAKADADADSWMSTSQVFDGVDVGKLNRILNGLDSAKLRKRRTLYARVFNEAMISQEPGKGISFTNMLLMLAHHKLIDDREALVYVLSLLAEQNQTKVFFFSVLRTSSREPRSTNSLTTWSTWIVYDLC